MREHRNASRQSHAVFIAAMACRLRPAGVLASFEFSLSSEEEEEEEEEEERTLRNVEFVTFKSSTAELVIVRDAGYSKQCNSKNSSQYFVVAAL